MKDQEVIFLISDELFIINCLIRITDQAGVKLSITYCNWKVVDPRKPWSA